MPLIYLFLPLLDGVKIVLSNLCFNAFSILMNLYFFFNGGAACLAMRKRRTEPFGQKAERALCGLRIKQKKAVMAGTASADFPRASQYGGKCARTGLEGRGCRRGALYAGRFSGPPDLRF